MSRVTRRRFLKGTAAATGAFFISSSANRVLGANEAVRVGVVGFNGQGGGHIGRFLSLEKQGVRLVALCDADQAVIDKQVTNLGKKDIKVSAYQDVRKMLENKELDAISTATPNHWHSLVTIWACQAGKDVYVEKPISHELAEGRKCWEAQQKYNRVVWHGTQSRSDLGLAAALEFIKAGNIGKVTFVRGFCYKPRKSIGKTQGEQPIPATVNYDLWCGPAPMEPLRRKRLHYDWHWVWPTGNGDIGNQGVHEMDMCRRALGQQTFPERVFAFGGRFGYDDDATTPNTLISYYDYKPVPFIFEVRGLPMKAGSDAMDAYRRLVRVGVWIQCEGGYYAGGGSGGWIYDKAGTKVKEFKQSGQGDHQGNFIKAVRSRRAEDNNCNALEGHYTAGLCHLGNIPYRVGKEVGADAIADFVKGNAEATDSLDRLKDHLQSNNVDAKSTKINFGAWLQFDPKKEQFTGELADAANKYLTREYRKPYVVPDQV